MLGYVEAELVNEGKRQNFNELNEETRKEEERISRMLQRRGYIVTDTRDIQEYREKDIDFVVEMQKQVINVEVKADKQMHSTGNFYIEFSHDRPTKGKTQGWYFYCEADIICYTDMVNNKGYMLNWKKMKPNLHGEYPIKGNWNQHDKGTWTRGYLVDIEDAKRKGFIVEEYYH